MTAADGPLGGGDPFYGIYESADGWVALAALEPHFRTRVVAELGIPAGTADALAEAFRERSSARLGALGRRARPPARGRRREVATSGVG